MWWHELRTGVLHDYQGVEYSHSSRIFTLQESELVSKSLRIMNNHFTEEK